MNSLDPRLQARTRLLNRHTPGSGPVVYWMRTAVRAHDNPALDVALHMGRTLHQPVFVYHGLSERYPYASDRHHRFILEGARDVRTQLEAQGIAYAFHLERAGHRADVLHLLGQTAGLIVTEEMPVDPLRRWTRALADRADAAVWAVDTATVVPMRVVGRGIDRAFAYRKRIEPLLDEALAPWSPQAVGPSSLPDLPFEPFDLDRDLAQAIAGCDIDHSLPPVQGTTGGTSAGLARWRDFVDSGRIHRYAKDRNDVLLNGVSRMSAYLHYGMVAPRQLAREARDVGAHKYVDELVVWRELAYTWCLYHRVHEGLEALPQWAQTSLHAHRHDPRPVCPTLDSLHRGDVGAPLWDLAQRSLLRHGELHNNVRMTWGKALLAWSPHPEAALARLVDLNHRYALDGRDPASFGGLLWCMGQFDRPFPEQPVWGTVRARSVSSHAKRIDLARWGAEIQRPRERTVLIIGAGLAGAMAARKLADQGVRVQVIDTSRGAEGRLAARLQLTDPRLTSSVERWMDAGWLTERDGAWVSEPSHRLGMELLADLPQRTTRATSLHRSASGWTVTVEEGPELHTDDLIVALPAPQAAILLKDHPFGPQLASCHDPQGFQADCLFDKDLVVIGDAFAGGDTQGALLSAMAAVGRLLGR